MTEPSPSQSDAPEDLGDVIDGSSLEGPLDALGLDGFGLASIGLDGAGAQLATLAASAFTSATILPGTSEWALAGIVALGDVAVWLAVLVASLANVAGSVASWAIGRYATTWRGHRLFPVPPDKLERYEAFYARWGVWSLLLSWTPFVGDPLTIVSGVMRTPLTVFLPLVALAKSGRYVVVALVAQGLL